MANKSREGNLREEDGNENVTRDSEEYVTFAEVDDENVEEVNKLQQDESIEDEAQSQKHPQTLPSRAAETPTLNESPKSAKKFKKDNVTALLKQSMEKREKRAKARKKENISRNQNLQKMIPYFTSLCQCTNLPEKCHPHIST
ncbi:unnamed protein product [Psylliodes chrysocephalus]|uniref:Uncharacterized protein n=1 Tax=Psylliodes chrysocephalus TaxID=3402493 RepID=A0A9P0DAV3_9CUCU|nr:unnamed protein product [Psylliodes chrysocephala]